MLTLKHHAQNVEDFMAENAGDAQILPTSVYVEHAQGRWVPSITLVLP